MRTCALRRYSPVFGLKTRPVRVPVDALAPAAAWASTREHGAISNTAPRKAKTGNRFIGVGPALEAREQLRLAEQPACRAPAPEHNTPRKRQSAACREASSQATKTSTSPAPGVKAPGERYPGETFRFEVPGSEPFTTRSIYWRSPSQP